MSAQLDTIARYFALIESFATDAAAFDAVYHPGFVHTEYPNAVTPRVQENDLRMCLAGAARGKALLARQSLRIQHTVESGNQVVVEALWSGTIGNDRGPFRAGQVLKAFLCMVFEFREGRIYRQRNYDCYEPFPTGTAP